MAKKKAARRPPSRKRSTSAKNGSNGIDCRQIFDDRLSVAESNPEVHFSKGLEHDPTTGDVIASQFQHMIEQLKLLNQNPGSAAKSGFQLRTDTSASLRRFVNPQSGWALDTESTDPCCSIIPAPPQLDSEEEAAEMIELYWMSLLRDVPFAQWDDHVLVASAAAELSTLPLYINRDQPNEAPATARFEVIPLTSKSVFRGGELARVGNAGAGIAENVGPYLSQFLLHEIPYGTLRIPQRSIHAASGIDYMTDWSDRSSRLQMASTWFPIKAWTRTVAR